MATDTIYLSDERALDIIKDGHTTDGNTYVYDFASRGGTRVSDDWQNVSGLRQGYTVVSPEGMYKVTGGETGGYTYEDGDPDAFTEYLSTQRTVDTKAAERRPIIDGDTGDIMYYDGYGRLVGTEKGTDKSGSLPSGGISSGGSFGGGSAGSGEDYLKKAYSAAAAAEKAALEGAYQISSAELEAGAAEIGPAFRDARNETAAQSEIERRSFNTMAAARGLNTGASAQSELARSVTLQSNLSALDRAEASALADVELERYKLRAQYEADIAEAEARGSYELASALYSEYVRADEALAARQQAAAELQYKYDALAQSAAESAASAELAASKQAQQTAMDVWETLGYANDYVSSVLGVPAGTPTSDQSYRDAQQALKSSSSSGKGSGSSSSSKGSSSSSSSGSSEPDVGSGLSVTEQLFREMYNSGYPSTYLVEQGYSDAKRKELMEEYLKWHENGGATPDFTKVSAGSVLDLGYGPLSAASLQKLFEAGLIDFRFSGDGYTVYRVKQNTQG